MSFSPSNRGTRASSIGPWTLNNPRNKRMPELCDNEQVELPPDAAIAADHRNPRRRQRPGEEPEVGVLTQTEPRHELDLLVLNEQAKADILVGLRAIELRADLER